MKIDIISWPCDFKVELTLDEFYLVKDLLGMRLKTNGEVMKLIVERGIIELAGKQPEEGH